MAKGREPRIKNLHSSKTDAGIAANAAPNYDLMPPIFSLERVQPTGYCLSNLCKEDKAAFADAIFKRKSITWSDIKKLDRHALGFEKIDKSSIKAPLPRFITEDMDHFLAFRFNGMKPMIGYRKQNIFFVLWFDKDFTLYAH